MSEERAIQGNFRLSSTDDFQIVVVDRLYDLVDRPEAMAWIGRLFSLKVKGYLSSYPYGALPFGESDFFGTHWILCKKSSDQLKPVMGIKTIELKIAELFKVAFPPVSITVGENRVSQSRAVDGHIRKTRSSSYNLGYIGSWTADRSDGERSRERSQLYQTVFSAFMWHWMHAFSVDAAIAFGAVRFRVDRSLNRIGTSRLRGPDGDEISNFSVASFFDEEVFPGVLYRDALSTEAKEASEALNELWRNRLTLCPESSPLTRLPDLEEEAA